MGWNDSGYSRRAMDNAIASGYSPRQPDGKTMVAGSVSAVIAVAVRDFAKTQGVSLHAVLEAMCLGHSTWKRMRAHEAITQATVLKIMKYMGTDLRSVLTKYHRS